MSQAGPVIARTVRISPADIDDARLVLHAILRVDDGGQLPHVVVVDPAELALEPGMYQLISDVLAHVGDMLSRHPSIGTPITFQIPVGERARERADLTDLLLASLPYDFRTRDTKIEPLLSPPEVEQ